ncbi:RNA ligase family protein [Paenibacillus daejeonensis]|uniref:ATP-dependent DNA ligase n=1 Tax=Paenibacillus daejeonensis TaxID=135193 RepID=UPI00036D7769|nr:RNA ligase family protein [Paenibacillus daejeonensis]
MKPIIPFEPVRYDEIPTGSEWTYQLKWDGVRILAYHQPGDSRLFNRHLRERTDQFPELLPSFLHAQDYIVDGEVIALAADGKPSFHEVMRRDGIRRLARVPSLIYEVPVTYMIFDLLWLNGQSLMDRPLSERQALLAEHLIPTSTIQPVQSHPNGEALFQVVRQHNLEGIVCKRLDSLYRPDGKDDRWVKVKNYGDIIAVIGGYTTRDGVVNSLLSGIYQDGKLYFIGKVGTGKLTAEDWRHLTKIVSSIATETSPFANQHPDMRGANWIIPKLTAKIQFTEWRWHEGRTLRHPSLQAFVEVPPESCTFKP